MPEPTVTVRMKEIAKPGMSRITLASPWQCGSGWAARRLFTANSPAMGKKSNAADRATLRNHRPQGVMQAIPRATFLIA